MFLVLNKKTNKPFSHKTFFNKVQVRSMSGRKAITKMLGAAAIGGAGAFGAAMGKNAYDVTKEAGKKGVKKAVKVVKKTIEDNSGGNDGGGTASGSGMSTNSGEAVMSTSPIESWDFFRVLNPEWFSRSPFTVDTTYDALTVMLIFFIISLIVIVYVMWSSYFSNMVTSFLIGEKKLPIFHLALISIAVLVSVLIVSLIYVIAFTTLMVEAASLKGLSSDITLLKGEIEELRALLEEYSKKS